MSALLVLTPFWLFGGGAPRLLTAFSGPSAAGLAQLCALDGALYFSEQVGVKYLSLYLFLYLHLYL